MKNYVAILLAFLLVGCATTKRSYFGITGTGISSAYKTDNGYTINYAIYVTKSVKGLRLYTYENGRQTGSAQFNIEGQQGPIIRVDMAIESKRLTTVIVQTIAYSTSVDQVGFGQSINKTDTLDLQKIFHAEKR